MSTAAAGRELHVDALTGVRALAAGWVVAYHLWLNAGHPSLALHVIGVDLTPLVTMGWLGVDIFFVLSGFVLTWQALHEAPSFPRMRERGVVPTSFWQHAGIFLRRRILRVYPAYLASVTVLLPLAWMNVYRTPPTLPDIALHLVMFHNFVAGYVDSINGVFWSMPFEWQFYIVFPLLILPVLRGHTRWLVAIAVAVAVGMKLSSALLGPGDEIAQFPWRIDEFVAGMAGAAIAVRSRWSARALARATWVAAISLIAGAWIIGIRNPVWWEPGALPLVRAAWIDVTVATLLIGLSGSASVISGLFASRMMVWLGTISYSVYLWHLPTLDLTRSAIRRHVPTMPMVLDLAVTVVVVLAVSAASYYAIERPFHGPSRDASARWRDPRFRLFAVGVWILGIFAVAARFTP